MVNTKKSNQTESSKTEALDFNLPEPQPLMVVISGLSGAGKDALMQKLRIRYPQAHYVVTCTDRAPRKNEVDGFDYFFVSTVEFEEMIVRNELIEHSKVYNQYKGGRKKQVFDALQQGKDAIMRLDVQGAIKIKASFPEALLIFVSPASKEEWRKRFLNRQTDTPEQIKVRLETARQEMEKMDDFEYVVINAENQLEKAVQNIIAIIQAEHCRTHPRRIAL